jgi:hypothetical protein
MTPKILRKLILPLFLAALLISACDEAEITPTPTEIDVDAVYTAVAATAFAKQTNTETNQATKTVSPTSTVTLTNMATQPPTITETIQPASTAINTPIVSLGTPAPTEMMIPSGPVGCNNSGFIQDVTIPNNTKLVAGETFTKTWRIMNTGTCAWNANYQFTFVSGNKLGSNTANIQRTIGRGVATDISLNMVAPNSPGTYSSYWRMADDSGVLFGIGFKVVIIVPGAISTPSPVAAPTATSPTPDNP